MKNIILHPIVEKSDDFTQLNLVYLRGDWATKVKCVSLIDIFRGLLLCMAKNA